MSWLVLCSANDAPAAWAAGGLQRRGLQPVEVISPHALVCSRSLVHEITDGRPRTTFTLPDGRLIDSARFRGGINRVLELPLDHLAGASGEDALYAQQELHAVVLSVLHGLGDRMINGPTPQGLAGRPRSHCEWIWLAGRAGLRTADYQEGDLDGGITSGVPNGTAARAIVFDGCVYGAALPAGVEAGAIALARLAETRLIGIELVQSAGGDWWFSGASIVPDFRIGGDALLDAIATALSGSVS